jgi:hypothetical protein
MSCPGCGLLRSTSTCAHYDAPISRQPATVLVCHLNPQESDLSVCAGWAGCHNRDESLALRIASARETLTPEVVAAVRDYRSPVPLFASGAEAADHGQADVACPGGDALEVITTIDRIRTNRHP